MHELKIAEELAAMVSHHAAEAGLRVVEKVNISVGQFVQVVPDLLEAAFGIAAAGSVASAARLDIEIIAAEMRCRSCGTEYRPYDDLHACLACGSTDIDVVHGKELFIKSIEGE
jgi:hydrogenase nickel incorporation protein HypA/HybF